MSQVFVVTVQFEVDDSVDHEVLREVAATLDGAKRLCGHHALEVYADVIPKGQDADVKIVWDDQPANGGLSGVCEQTGHRYVIWAAPVRS